jgi:Membrane dipeptidase (Peptidase family M19)
MSRLMPASTPQNASQIKDVHDRISSWGQVAHSESWYYSTIEDIIEGSSMLPTSSVKIRFGTDFTQGYGEPFFRYITHDKGYGRKLTDFGEIVMPEGFRRLEDFPNMTEALERHGWPERRIRKIMGENWFRTFRDAWGADAMGITSGSARGDQRARRPPGMMRRLVRSPAAPKIVMVAGEGRWSGKLFADRCRGDRGNHCHRPSIAGRRCRLRHPALRLASLRCREEVRERYVLGPCRLS